MKLSAILVKLSLIKLFFTAVEEWSSTAKTKSPACRKKPNFLEAVFVQKSWAFGNDAKKAKLANKKPNFLDADFVWKSWAFGNGAKKSPTFCMQISFGKVGLLGFCVF